MDGYQFIADLFKSLTSVAWPVAIVAIVYMFKSRLEELLPFLNLQYKDFKFSLSKTEEKAEALPEPKDAVPPPEDDDFDKLLKVSPAAAVVHIRKQLESSLAEYAEARGMTLIPIGLYRFPKELLKHGLIDQTTADVLAGLAKTAAAASHSNSEEITESDARRFRDLAERVMRGLGILGAAARMPPPSPIGT